MTSDAGTFRLFAGIDEAGLGPLLGPLCIGFSAFRAPGESAELWSALESVVARAPKGADGRFVVADSKVVHARNPRGEQRLEDTALGFLALLDPARRPPPTGAALARHTPGELACAPEVWDLGPWNACLDRPLPRCRELAALELRTERLARALRAREVELVDGGVRVLPAEALNRSFAETNNKSKSLWDAAAPVIERLWRRYGGEGLRLTVDRQGGRMRYGGLLARALPRARVEVRSETPPCSEYFVQQEDPRGGAGRRMRITFAERAEQRSFAVALASCFAKYARETCMTAFNDYFHERAPGLRPTAGYTTDARRWLQDAEAVLADLPLAPTALVRRR
jgi:hypothetical protein